MVVPSTHTPFVGQAVTINLQVGHAGEWEVLPRNPERFEKFVAAGPVSEQPVIGPDGKVPAGLMKPAEPGLYVVGYRSKPRAHEMTPEKFEDYLVEEGLESIVSLRAERGETGKAGKEVYSRAAKALLWTRPSPTDPAAAPAAPPAPDAAGTSASQPVDRDLGFRYELICLSDPRSAKPGQTISVLAEFENSPAKNARVCLVDPAADDHIADARTGEDGRAVIEIPERYVGNWRSRPLVLLSVYMLEAPKDSGADWESLWASVTFLANAADSANPAAGAADSSQPEISKPESPKP